MSVNYEYYRIFYYVARYGSLTSAANVLGSNQPNVTRCMNKLEQELGCRLLLRSSRGVSLTPEGKRLYDRAAAACAQLQAAEEELSGSRRLETGSISIAASETALHMILLQKLRDFRARYPNIRLRISNHSTPQAIAALRGGMADLAVVTTPAGTSPPLRESRLLPFQEILIGGPHFAALAERRLSPKELLSVPLICLGQDTATYRFYERLFLQEGLPFQVDTEAATADQILPLVENNLGLAFLPEAFAAEALSHGEVVRVPVDLRIPRRHVCLITDTSRPPSIAAREFQRLLCER